VKYIVCNADEGDPGAYIDKYLMEEQPHSVLLGMMVAGWFCGARTGVLYIRAEYPDSVTRMNAAVQELRDAGWLGKNIQGTGFDFDFKTIKGAGAYICGEETSLLESLEGKRPYPRIKPPFFPAVFGLYNCPTIVNNVETLCHVKHILALGSAEFAKLGTPGDGGTRTLCVSGDVASPGYYELGCGQVTVGQLINEVCGGMKPGRKLKAIIPGGSSAKVLRAGETFKMKRKGTDGTESVVEVDLLDLVMDANSLAAAGSMIGSAGVMILDDSRDMVWVLNNINDFYAHESCGQCTPCREGSLWMAKVTTRMARGQRTAGDADTLMRIADHIAGRTICAFGEACAWPTQSFVTKFREEFQPREGAAVNGSDGH
jgi:NADH-quinone oxidoreductase subunit F